MKKMLCLGMMSGTSLDGLDLCLVSFWKDEQQWLYEIMSAKTLQYSTEMKRQLSTVEELSACDFVMLENKYGQYLGNAALEFIAESGVFPSLIASHGHTVFHQPQLGMTKQIGSGAEIAARTGIPTINDFRSLDVALGGQGAPLVPIGDELLFPRYAYCLNLGGFANISTRRDGRRIAYDICPVNIVLNHITRDIGLEYDDKGALARSGRIHQCLLSELNALPFYQQVNPKSLGREWLEKEFLPIIGKYQIPETDALATVCEHVATQLAASVTDSASVLVTGGGAYNDFLVERFRHLSNARVVIPDDNTIQFKEALIFAFLGLLRMRGEVNTLRHVTGAKEDSVGGCVYAVNTRTSAS